MMTQTLSQLVRELRAGSSSAESCTGTRVECAAEWTDVNAIISHDPDAVLQAAAAADRQRDNGDATGALHGIPVLIKDNIAVAGYPSTLATNALRDYRPRRNAAVVDRILVAGGIVFGKANMHELALGVTGAESAFGPVRNPYDLRRIAGGSSSGTAAAVAAGIVPAGLGTDTGGSIRIPAALCGVCGFRPTPGRYSMEGIVPVSPTRDAVGPIARRVGDLALLDRVLLGQAVDDPLPETLAGLRIGIPRDFFYATLTDEVEAIITQVLEAMAAAGVELIDADVPNVEALNRAIAVPVIVHELHEHMPAFLAEQVPGLSFADVVSMVEAPDVLQLLQIDAARGRQFSAAYGEAMRTARPALQASYRRYFADNRLDSLLIPATSLPAYPLDQDPTVEIRGEALSVMAALARNMGPATTAGHPSLTIPAGLTEAGLPVGLLLEAPAGGDRKLLSVGLALEALLGSLVPPTR